MRLVCTRIPVVTSLMLASSLCMAEGVVLDNGAQVGAELLVGAGYDTNVALMNDNEISSTFWETVGMMGIELNPGSMQHALDFIFNDRRYQNTDQDDYTDWTIAYLGHWEPTSRHRTDITLSLNNLHQQRGLGYTRYLEIPLSSPLEYTQSEAGLSYEYGSLVATGRIGAEILYTAFRFNNFADYTEGLDYKGPKVHGWFDYDVGAVTSLTFDASFQDIVYDGIDTGGSRDSQVTLLLVGAKWSGLAKTAGKFKVGYEKRAFENQTRSEFTGLAIDAGVTWSPRTYSTVDLALTRRTTESGFSDLIVNTTFQVDWQHAWSDITSTSLSYQFLNLDEEGVNQRTERRNYLGLAYSRQLAKWLTVNTEYSVTINRSSQLLFDYDNQVFLIGFKGIL